MAMIEREIDGAIATVTMNRPDKRNAMSDAFIAELENAFVTMPGAVRVIILDMIQFGGRPVVSAMFGAVIGGGLEIAAATHVRIAEPSTIFQLPEGRRGIFVGGGATVRVGRILGADRMTEMMLTGRKYGAEDGERLGLAHYSVGEGEALALARELAGKISRNAPLSNYFMVQALARIEDMSKADGLFTESLCAALSQTTPDAQEGLHAFLEKRAPKFR
jgi:enoyl-CoA hydratase/carnithine racemase